jgi:tetratricopeptide (TPR) repeat protein/transglutaminase-like putative cysteine protease
MKYHSLLLGSAALLCGTAASAGEEVLYQPAPDWIAPVELPQLRRGPPIVLYDDQRRIEEGRLVSYIDRAIRVDNPQTLTMLGTLQTSWLPDKGDLIVHRVAILRGDEVIDVLAAGAKLEVLRRERQLEQRMIDGARTATLAVPGLRVGDVLRVSYSTTLSDQALDKEVQDTIGLPAEPFSAGFARVRLSWPAASDVRWQASKGIDLPEPVVHDGFAAIEVPLPLPERDEVPDDAPLRYRMPPMLQAGTFASWTEVSRVMAPLFATEGTIASDGPIAGEVARIERAHSGQLERAVAALRLVQDEVAYLLNGLEGGNYIPQKPAETWEMRYGDCKAKTMLLLAMLREMGIESEAVLVASELGDVVPQMLPLPGAFDHVIVHATIDGTDYWLDGTNSGASMQVVHEVPAFHVALPLRAGGAELLPMAQRPQQTYDRLARITFDNRAGLDVPMLFQAEWTLTGPAAAPFRAVIGQGSEKQVDDFVAGFATSQLGEGLVVDSHIAFDEATNEATVKVEGLMDSYWRWERGVGSRQLSLPSQAFEFRPDRSRPAWRDIPVAMPGPFSERMEVTMLLPESGGDYALEGKPAFETEVAGVRMSRQSELDDDRLTITETTAWPGGEIASAQIAAERQKASRFGSANLALRAPRDIDRRFKPEVRGDRTRYAKIEAAYAALIAHDTDDLDNYRFRSQFRAMTWDWPGAIADFDTVIEREPDAQSYLLRASLKTEIGDLDGALADAQAGWDLDPSLEAAFTLSNILPYVGRLEDAIELLEQQNGTPEEESQLAMAISELEAQAGRKEQGLQRIDDLLAARPNDPQMLNAKCWYQATWNYRAEELDALCTEAVEKADASAPVLDSRAMGYYRLGRLQDALKDLESALSTSPELTPSLFMRGVVRRELGDRAGEEDIREALARQPSLAREYARFGIEAD